MKSPLETFRVGSTWRGRSDGRMCRSDEEQDGRFLIRQRALGGQFGSESVMPWKVDSDLAKPQFEKLELTEIFVEEVSGCEIASGTSDGVLTTSGELGIFG